MNPRAKTADRRPTAPLFRRLFSLVLLTTVVVAVTGCPSSKEAQNAVFGKCTMNGQPVKGEVVLVGGGKEVPGPILNGEYRVENPPKGDCDILVKALPGSDIKLTAPSKDVGNVKDGPGSMPEVPGSTGVAPPAKYAQVGNGLKVTVKGGKQKHDIDLQP